MNEILTMCQNMIWNVTHRMGFIDVIDILIVAVIIYLLLKLTKQTRSSAVLKGILILLVVVAISILLGLTSLSWLMMAILNHSVVVLVVIFQPEIRNALERMGRARFLNKSKSVGQGVVSGSAADEIVQTLTDLSRRYVGALIIIERRTGLEDIVDTGTKLDAIITAPLLENIFEPNTPLHDGAVVVRGERVMAAGCILPLAQSRSVSRELGTRHRAGIGISELTDALVLIVSEETGTISKAESGVLTRNLTENELHALLDNVLKTPDTGIIAYIRSLTKWKEAGKNG